MNENFSTRLARAIEQAGLPKKDVASAVGVHPPALSRWLNGSVPESRYLIALANTLNVRVNWLLNGDGPEPTSQIELVESFDRTPPPERTIQPTWLPVISWAHAGEATSYEELPKHWQEHIPTTCKSRDAFALIISGDSMSPYCRDGDIAVVMPHEEPRNGCMVVAKLRCDGIVLRRYARAKDIIRLSPENPAYPPADYSPKDFHWIYPVHSTVRREW